MTKRLGEFIRIFLIFLIAFVFASFAFLKDQDDDEDNIVTGFLTQFQRSQGDIDVVSTRDGPDRVAMLILLAGFAILMILVMLNLMIAIMSDAIDEERATARARWVSCTPVSSVCSCAADSARVVYRTVLFGGDERDASNSLLRRTNSLLLLRPVFPIGLQSALHGFTAAPPLFAVR